MRIQRLGLVMPALALLALPAHRPAWALEPAFEVTGTYDAVVDGSTARLTLNDDGSAQYVVRWLSGEESNILRKLTVKGRWARQEDALTFTFPNPGGTGKIVYEVSPCLSYKSFGKTSCSPGLHVVTSDLPANRTWELWKTTLLTP